MLARFGLVPDADHLLGAQDLGSLQLAVIPTKGMTLVLPGSPTPLRVVKVLPVTAVYPHASESGLVVIVVRGRGR